MSKLPEWIDRPELLPHYRSHGGKWNVCCSCNQSGVLAKALAIAWEALAHSDRMTVLGNADYYNELKVAMRRIEELGK
jgi:hypothetical protein